MSNNHKEQYTYYCETEAKLIIEERDKGSVPTQCKNNVSHIIKAESVFVSMGDYCNFTDDLTIPERFDLTSLDYGNMTAEGKKLLELMKALLTCAKYRGLINM